LSASAELLVNRSQPVDQLSSFHSSSHIHSYGVHHYYVTRHVLMPSVLDSGGWVTGRAPGL